LVFVSLSPGTYEGKPLHRGVIVAGLVIITPAMLWAGRFDGVLALGWAWLLALLVVSLFGVTAWLVRGHWNRFVSITLIASVGATFVAAQLWQNGRGLLGIYGQYPFRSAFVDFSYGDQMAAKIAVQRWLLERTDAGDRIAIWTDPTRLTADIAGMQLWGDVNLVTTQAKLDRDTTTRLEELRPSVIAMYAPDKAQIDSFFTSLPPWALPTELECTREPYLGIGTGEAVACVTKLTWVG